MLNRRNLLPVGICVTVVCLAAPVVRSIRPQVAQAQSIETILWNFAGSPDGADPTAGIIEDASGALYGTTELGGIYGGRRSKGLGTAFKLNPNGPGYSEQIIWSFGNGRDGMLPNAALTFGSSGVLYGTTTGGGLHGKGTVFALVPSSSGYAERVLWNFGRERDGFWPYGSVITGASGVLYGTTVAGGKNGGGIVFALTPSRSGYVENVLWSFGAPSKAGQADGEAPYAGLVADAAGALYGTTYYGGTYGSGTAYKLAPQSGKYNESVIWSFGGSGDGKFPIAGLIAGTAGVLYGTCSEGGSRPAGGGMAFELAPSSSGYVESQLHQFGFRADGWRPFAALTMGPGGLLYGTTIFGADYRNGESGAAFSLTLRQRKTAESVLWNFGAGSDGYGPNGLTADASGTLFGTTCCGGSAGNGTVFELTR